MKMNESGLWKVVFHLFWSQMEKIKHHNYLIFKTFLFVFSFDKPGLGEVIFFFFCQGYDSVINNHADTSS